MHVVSEHNTLCAECCYLHAASALALLSRCVVSPQACAGSSGATEPPLAELPAPAGPSTRDCTPSRQRIGGLLPGTPQTAPPAASNTNANSMMVSPPPKRLATAVRAPGAATNSQQHALMSPPPARTRGNNRRLVMGDSNPAGVCCVGAPGCGGWCCCIIDKRLSVFIASHKLLSN